MPPKAQDAANGFFKFGKAPAKRDRRNLAFSAILKAAPPPAPPEYDFDVQHNGVPTPMFLNDDFGDCVIAGRAHQTLRFELLEQKKVISIGDTEVKREYFKETGGEDTGLVVLDSLSLWRKRGWKVGKETLKIKAFAELDRTDPEEIKSAIFFDVGVGIGITLACASMDQFHAGKPWDVVNGAAGRPRPDMGHYVYLSGYTLLGPVCVTWGRKQQMTWAFMDKHCDEAYAIIDAINTTKQKRGIDVKKLDSFLLTVN